MGQILLSQVRPLGIPLKITALQQEPWTPRIPSVSLFVWLGEENRSEGRWHCHILRSFNGTPQGYASQIQRPIFSWNPWLGNRPVYWTQHRGANPSRRGTCKFAKWRGSETKVQNLLPSLLDANGDSKTLPNPVERHQVVFHCFSNFLPSWEGIQCCVQSPHQTKKQTQHNRAWWSETAPDKPSSWCWQFDCNTPSPPISLSRVVY